MSEFLGEITSWFIVEKTVIKPTFGDDYPEDDYDESIDDVIVIGGNMKLLNGGSGHRMTSEVEKRDGDFIETEDGIYLLVGEGDFSHYNNSPHTMELWNSL